VFGVVDVECHRYTKYTIMVRIFNMILSHKKNIAPYWRVIINSFLIVVCLVLAAGIAEMSGGLRHSIERLGYVRDSYEQARNQNSDLTQEYRDLTTPDGVEYYVRNHYRAVSSGEELVVVVDPQEVIMPPVEKPVEFWEQVRILLRIP
jgi:hypothetical protein